MGKIRYALLDTDFISKLHITRKNDANRMIDRVVELPDYQFVCHKQIVIELERHNATAIEWLQNKISEKVIKKYSDEQLMELLYNEYGNNAASIFLFYLNHACEAFSSTFYDEYYGSLEEKIYLSASEFVKEVEQCDVLVGCDNNLGELKTFLMQQILQNIEEIQLYIFCSDDKKARMSLSGVGKIPCISAIASFYVLKERLQMEREEAKLYFDSWMGLHRAKGQTSFKVHKDTKEMQLVKMDGYEIFDRIYDGTICMLKNGNLKVKEKA